MSRLEPIDLVDFTGGFVPRRSQFTLAQNESPDMVNIEVDPRFGFSTRRGWQRWNLDDIELPTQWFPRSAEQHPLADGTFEVYIADDTAPEVPADGTIWASGPDAVFEILTDGTSPIPCGAHPHLADYAAWGNIMYIACGRNNRTAQRDGSSSTATLLNDASAAYNDEYTNPIGGHFPQAEMCEAHSGYIFAANITEGGTAFPNRVRWSHPDNPTDWATLDFIDIERGGAAITALLSFRDHLLIFKTDSVWALYGYDRDSWQLIQVSATVGAASPTSVCRSETAAYFFSSSNRGGIYAYTGSAPIHLSEKVRGVIEQITNHHNVFIGWMGRRLWVSLPVSFSRTSTVTPVVTKETALTQSFDNTVLVFDPEIGDGAWVRHAPAVGSLGPMVNHSDIDDRYPMAVLQGDTGAAAIVLLDYRDDANDVILEEYATFITDPAGNRITDPQGFFIIDGVAPLGSPFVSYYRTSWQHAGWPERRKSFLRPRYVNRVPVQDVAIRANAYWDYDEARPRRSGTRVLTAEGGAHWGDAGLDWGDEGATWGDAQRGGQINRITRSLGVCRALQLEVGSDPSTPGRAWALDLIHLPYNLRRFTT